MTSFETVFARFPHHIQDNITYQTRKLEDGTDSLAVQRYRDFIVANRHNPNKFLFYPEFFKEEMKSIDRQIFHQKHDRVVRVGLRCGNDKCRSTNTKVHQVQNRSGDEAATTVIYCYDCKRTTMF
jgi:hypothetical protein